MGGDDRDQKGKQQDDNKETCCICCDTFDPNEDGGSFACVASHFYCGECSDIFVNSVLAGAGSMPPKCSLCRGEIPPLMFERLLDEEQTSTYLTYLAMQALEPNERIVSCTSCSYFEVRTDVPALFFCTACGQGHCFHCKVNLPIVESDEDDDGFAAGSKQAEISTHFECAEFAEAKGIVDKALTGGSKMPCPGCGLMGRKDEVECMHMNCVRCGASWCYCCGLSVTVCDKAPRHGGDPIYGHNEDWELNPRRCPMYLSNIIEVDEEWEEDIDDEEGYEAACLDKFHRWRTLNLLSDAKRRIGTQMWARLRERYASVQNCGFSDADIDNAKGVPLFARPVMEPPSQRPRHGDDPSSSSSGRDAVVDLTR